MLFFRVRHNAYKQKCSNCGKSIPETPALGEKSPGQFWVAVRISFARGHMGVESVVACQRCRQLDTWDHFEDPKNPAKIPDDPDGAHVTAIWEKRLGRQRDSAVGTEQLRPREEGVRSPAVGGAGGVRVGM